MNIRVGRFELVPIDKWNWSVYRIADDGEKGKRSAPDGTRLVPMEKYTSTIPAGLEIIRQLALKTEDMAVVADIEGALSRIAELNGEFEQVAARIEEAVDDHATD